MAYCYTLVEIKDADVEVGKFVILRTWAAQRIYDQ